MKKITLLMVALSLLLAFTGCNQKEKKIAKIIDGITEEQMGEINEIVAASWDLDADKVVFDIGYTHDTIYISCYDTFSIESLDRNLQKDFSCFPQRGVPNRAQGVRPTASSSRITSSS